MKTGYQISVILICILVGSYTAITASTLGPEDVFNPASVLYFPGIVMQLIANEGNGIICVDACGPCSAWGPYHILVDGKCVLPDNIPDTSVVELNEKPEQEINYSPSKFIDGITEIINHEHEPLTYRATIPVIDDTYLSKNVKQWTDTWRFELEARHEQYGDDFYTELGRLLMKNEMQYQMNSLGIVNAEDDFRVISGMALQSLPPHISYSSVVHATDGYYYLLQGMANANKVSYYKTTQLQYPKLTPHNLPISDNDVLPLILIQMKGDNDLKSEPPFVVLSHPGEIEFYNKTPGKLTITISKDGASEYDSKQTQEIFTRSNSGSTWQFLEPGSYSWRGRVPATIDNKEYVLNTGGGILVLSDDMSNLSRAEQIETAKMILMTSSLPIVGIGQQGTDDTLYISFDEAINELLPESKQYYLQRAQEIIPFDITIKLDR